jgi:uncharacterized protein YdhG (YjbR/CyaY superfamily)
MQYFKALSPQQSKTIKSIFKVIQVKYPELELVIAWNQPMLKIGTDYVLGISASKHHILIAPWSKEVLAKFASKMEHLEVKKKTKGTE